MKPVRTASRDVRPLASPRDEPAFLRPGERTLLLFGGKGGVGKTTCATATALRFARRRPHQEFLLASTDPAHSLQDCLGTAARPPNLCVLELDPQQSLRKFKAAHAGHLRQIAQRGTFLDDEDTGQFLDLSLPGLDELMAFIELAALAERRDYADIVVDTAPTGHTLRLLGLPDVLRQWLAALDAMLAKHRYLARLYGGRPRPDEADAFLDGLATTVEGLASLLTDPRRCCFVPVMLPEPLVTDETVRLVHALERMEVPVSEIVVNGVYAAGAECPACRETRLAQTQELHRIRAALSAYRLWTVPFQASEAAGGPPLARFWSCALRLELESMDDVPTETPQPIEPATSPRVEHPAPLPPPETKLLFFAGKGGVGKTTLASATALRLAEAYRDRQILLLSVDPAHSLGDCLGTRIGAQVVRLSDRLSAVEIDAVRELADVKMQYADEVAELFGRLTGPAAGLDIAFDHEVIERVMDLAPPGLDEVMALTRAGQFLETGQYDTLVCDAAPTGHLIRLLEMPLLIQQWLGVFFGLLLKYKRVLRLPRISEWLVGFSKQLKALRVLLANPDQSRLHAVAVPTEMALAETSDLLAACRNAGIHVPTLFVNRVRPAADCPTCNALIPEEGDICARLKLVCSGANAVVVYRGTPPRGLACLTELGRALYRN